MSFPAKDLARGNLSTLSMAITEHDAWRQAEHDANRALFNLRYTLGKLPDSHKLLFRDAAGLTSEEYDDLVRRP